MQTNSDIIPNLDEFQYHPIVSQTRSYVNTDDDNGSHIESMKSEWNRYRERLDNFYGQSAHIMTPMEIENNIYLDQRVSSSSEGTETNILTMRELYLDLLATLRSACEVHINEHVCLSRVISCRTSIFNREMKGIVPLAPLSFSQLDTDISRLLSIKDAAALKTVIMNEQSNDIIEQIMHQQLFPCPMSRMQSIIFESVLDYFILFKKR